MASDGDFFVALDTRKVWGTHDIGIGHSLRVHIRRLRAKLNAGLSSPPALVTIRGFGYRLVWEARPGAP